MSRVSVTVIALLALVALVLIAEPALADCGCGGGSRRGGPPTNANISGLGIGLAGIGMAWGMMWVGNRFAGRISGRREDEPRD